MDREMEKFKIKIEVEDAMREAGLRLNPTSSLKEPLDLANPDFDSVYVDVCAFCKQKIKTKDLGTDRYSFKSEIPCDCPENVENTRKYEEAYRVELERVTEEYRQERVKRLHKESKIPLRWEKRTFEHFSITPENQHAYDIAFRYAESFSPERGEGLLFTGTVGTGKTHLAAAVSLALMEKEFKVVFGTINTLLSEIRYSYSDEQADTEAELFNRYTTCDLLVIDDLGKERVSDWTEQIVFDIINTRYENNKALVITTNLGLKDIKSKYRENGEALVDRLIEMCKGIKLEGESWRRKAIG